MLASGSLATGTTFARRYVIRERIGSGGAGTVYRVFDREVADAVALKTLAPSLMGDKEAVLRFRREVRLARRVTHRNIVRTFDTGEHEGVRFMTMEFVEGRNLRSEIEKRAPLPLPRAVELAIQMAAGLLAAHEAGVIHRDLKPDNVMIEWTGRVVLTDFGIARALSRRGDAESTIDTMTGSGHGTPAYMAPEQVADDPQDHRTDLYALGLILYELISGHRPFEERTPLSTALARLHRDAPDIRKHVQVPESLAWLLTSMLRRDPDERPASAATVVRVLMEIQAELPHPVELRVQAEKHYRRAKAYARGPLFDMDISEAVQELERALELHPGHPEALAAHALSSLRAWFVPSPAPDRDWSEVARRSVSRAVAHAPELPQTMLASALLNLQTGSPRRGVRELRRAASLDPENGEALEHLGRLALEIGHLDLGFDLLAQAITVDPNRTNAMLDQARYSAILGRIGRFEAIMAQLVALEEHGGGDPVGRLAVEMRVAGWFGDLPRAQRCYESARKFRNPANAIIMDFGRALLGDVPAAAVEDLLIDLRTRTLNPSFIMLALKAGTEILCLRGDQERALTGLTEAANQHLLDLTWLEHCPGLDPIRDDPGFAHARNVVQRRVAGLWPQGIKAAP